MKNKKTALICGSFDPITLGHLDIVRRAASIFDTVYLTAFINPDKKYCFSQEERIKFMQDACADIPNVVCGFDTGMVCDYVKNNNIDCIVKGIRNEKDLSYETKMADFNREHSGRETLLLVASEALSDCSSTLVRETLKSGGDLSALLPESIISELKAAFEKNNDN